jgi:hypothetical protein
MLNLRRFARTTALTLTEPSWLDFWLVAPIIYMLILRAEYLEVSGLAGAWARWATSIMLAVYGATVAMSLIVLTGRALRARRARRVAA